MRMAVLAMALTGGLTAAHAAPVPPPPKNPVPVLPVTGALTPQILVLRPAADGKIRVNVIRTQKQVVMIAVAGGPPGAGAPPQMRQEMTTYIDAQVELRDVGDLTVFNAVGDPVSKDDALKALAKGGVVLVSADGKPVDPAFTRMFKEGTLVLGSPELIKQDAIFAGSTVVGAQAMPRPAVPAVLMPAPVQNAVPVIQPAGGK